MSHAKSPLARPFPAIPPIAGVTLRVARAQYKDWDRCDLTYVELAEGTAVAGVFTRNVCSSSEVDLGRANIAQGTARALVVNAGNANAFTGYRGREAVEAIMAQVSAHLDCAPRAGVRLLHRRHRRAFAQGQGAGRDRRGAAGCAVQLGGRREHHRHHRYFCQGRYWPRQWSMAAP